MKHKHKVGRGAQMSKSAPKRKLVSVGRTKQNRIKRSPAQLRKIRGRV